MKEKTPNKLIGESSPYLLQHANNPVDWHPWNEETLRKARDEDRPMLVSIGYSACHWCHVMAHETFEDPRSAEIMNAGFISVKVDREERPDVDAVYMRAVQAMTGQGGWPLHAFALPDGRPFYGGTYFPRGQWQQLCTAISKEFSANRAKLEDYAAKLDAGLNQPPIFTSADSEDESLSAALRTGASLLSGQMDTVNGGLGAAPKFPMPPALTFVLDYALLEKNDSYKDFLLLTLEKMALGGMYDQAGGGFARYSVDSFWKVPHFEKMLYDNAQLIRLYSQAYRAFGSLEMLKPVVESADFLMREMQLENGLFASALDADSEGEEGKFYLWTLDELQGILGNFFPDAQQIFRLGENDTWEKGTYILQRKSPLKDLAARFGESEEAMLSEINDIQALLLTEREKRPRPGLDHKALTGWNGLAISALVHAYFATQEEKYLSAANKTADYLINEMRTDDGGLYRAFANGRKYIPGFLDDYSLLIEGLLTLYEATFDTERIVQAEGLTGYVLEKFSREKSAMFSLSAKGLDDSPAQVVETADGVLPSGNSVMAANLLKLSRLLEKPAWEREAEEMIASMAEMVARYPLSHGAWMRNVLMRTFPFIDLVICGEKARSFSGEISTHYHPNVFMSGGDEVNQLPILKNRFRKGKTLLYVCRNKVCLEPVEGVHTALEMINERGTPHKFGR